MRSIDKLASLLVVLTLPGCGGGGSGDSGGGTSSGGSATTTFSEPIAISESNQSEVVDDYANAGGSLGILASIITEYNEISISPTNNANLVASSRQQLLPKNVETSVENCSVSGTVTRTTDSASLETSSVFESCSETNGNRITGSIDFTLAELIGLTVTDYCGSGAFFFDTSFTGFSFGNLVSTPGSFVFDGDMELCQEDLSNGDRYIVIAIDSLPIEVNASTVILENYIIELTTNSTGTSYTMSINGSVSSESIGGSYTVATSVPFEGSINSNDFITPSSGSARLGPCTK